METFILKVMAHELAKCTYRKLNIVDFQCKRKGKYTLNLNITKTQKSNVIW